MNHFSRLLPIGILSIALLQSCASVSVEDTQEKLSPYSSKPLMILVKDFDVPLNDLNVDRSGDQLAQFQQKTSTTMTLALVREINKFYPAQAYASTANATIPGGNYWIIDGKFLLVNQGSRALRMFIGLGAGGTKMETAVTVTDTSLFPAQDILAFDTTGGSNLTVGALEAASPVAAGAVAGAAENAAGSAWQGITDDTDRTARMIAARLSALLGQQGWITPDKVQKYKEINPNDMPDTTRINDSQQQSPGTQL